MQIQRKGRNTTKFVLKTNKQTNKTSNRQTRSCRYTPALPLSRCAAVGAANTPEGVYVDSAQELSKIALKTFFNAIFNFLFKFKNKFLSFSSFISQNQPLCSTGQLIPGPDQRYTARARVWLLLLLLLMSNAFVFEFFV